MFFACGTQWVHAGMAGGRVGLNYSGVEAVLRLLAIPPERHTALFTGLQIMERAALGEFSRQAEAASSRTVKPRSR